MRYITETISTCTGRFVFVYRGDKDPINFTRYVMARRRAAEYPPLVYTYFIYLIHYSINFKTGSYTESTFQRN